MAKPIKQQLIPEPLAPEFDRPCFRVYNHHIKIGGIDYIPGVWHHDIKYKNGADEADDTWLCSPLHVEAIIRSSCESAGYGRHLSFRNRDNQWLSWGMPEEMIVRRPESILAMLVSMGLDINYRHQRKIIYYISSQKPTVRAIAASSTGWQSASLFVLPNRSYGHGNAIFQSETVETGNYSYGGTLQGWQDTIGKICEKNPILMLAVCSGLAGPLLYHTTQGGGGFHIYGDSSTGKTTALLAAASVWGCGKTYQRTWSATANGLEGVASLRSDTLLVLDEIGESNPKEIGAVIYALANGVGKSRADRTGAAKSVRRWRIIILSSGELKISAHMSEGGQRTRAGQEIRLLEIPAIREHGAWDYLHGLKNGANLTSMIQQSAITHYGHAGPIFIQNLLEMAPQKIGQLPRDLEAFSREFKARNGQEARAVERFALIGFAGELAIKFGILPVTQGEAKSAALELYNVWRSMRAKMPSEDVKILNSIYDFISKHGDSYFSNIKLTNRSVRNRFGYWEASPTGRIYFFNTSGLQEAASGYELVRITNALDTHGIIAYRDPGKKQIQKRIPGGGRQRFYAIDPDKLESLL